MEEDVDEGNTSVLTSPPESPTRGPQSLTGVQGGSPKGRRCSKNQSPIHRRSPTSRLQENSKISPDSPTAGSPLRSPSGGPRVTSDFPNNTDNHHDSNKTEPLGNYLQKAPKRAETNDEGDADGGNDFDMSAPSVIPCPKVSLSHVSASPTVSNSSPPIPNSPPVLINSSPAPDEAPPGGDVGCDGITQKEGGGDGWVSFPFCSITTGPTTTDEEGRRRSK